MQTYFTFEPIGTIHSCFVEKFGIPRQPGLVPAARANLEIYDPYDRDEAFRGIEAFSHVWIVFVFHASAREKWQPTVRPPRLGGNKRIGVFATRSGFRPNPIGMSVVALEGIGREKGRLQLYLKGVDLLDGTPVLDIKPYLPYADCVADATGGFAHRAPSGGMAVGFSEAAAVVCRQVEADRPGFSELVVQLLGADPRPAYYNRKPVKETFGLRIYDLDVRWTCRQGKILILSIERPSGEDRAS